MKHFKVLYVLVAIGLLLALAPAASAAPNSAAIACSETRTIVAGDELGKLADQAYGNIGAYWALMWATNQNNKEDPAKFPNKIDNANLIEVGWLVCIPSQADAEAFLKDFDPVADTADLFGAGAKGKVIVATWWTSGGERAGLFQIRDQFLKENPDVEFVNSATVGAAGVNFKGQLLAKLIAGVPAADTFQLHAGKEVLLYSPDTFLVPLDSLIAELGLESKLPAGLLSMMKVNDHYWGIPVNIHRSNTMTCNKAILGGIGMTELPKTWPEFFTMADQLKAKNIVPIAIGTAEGWELGHTFEDVLAGALGADGYRGLWDGSVAWTDPRVTTALETFKKLITYANTDRGSLNWTAAADLTIEGTAACHIMGDWQIGEQVLNNKQPNVDYLFGVAPETTGIYVALSDMFAMPKNAPNPENARTWLRVASSKEAEEAFNPAKGSVCARTDCDTSTFGAYLQQATIDWGKDAIVPSVVHGAAAEQAWANDYSSIITLFATSGDVAAAQTALQAACVDAGVCK